MKDYGTIVQIGDCLISEDVILEYFSCDYETCKGICCIEGDSGAPLEERELESLERDYPKYSHLMSAKGRETVSGKGFFEIDFQGDIVTPVVPQTMECAYTHFDEAGNCMCAIEKCFFKGECRMRKPSSCWLYPIRITKLTGGSLALNLHRWDICKPAFEKGKKEGIRVYQFLREPLIDLFGEDFYEALCVAAAKVISESELEA